ncbi:hypothetical protein ACIBEJ_48820 [Nonomuraea sp. NPDC050790]|uniref:hypothetical protein n=1 Tax=Nonomuraea sp. NPDC050790 TaxID=3364371 RepID=UPI0037ADD930
MGIKLIVEALDHAPASLTPRERYALIVLAEDARDETRLVALGIEGNERVVRRLRAGRSERAAIIKALVDKGAIKSVKRGQKHQHAEYEICRLAPATPEDSSIRESQTDSQPPENPDAENPGNPDPEDDGLFSASGFSSPSIRKTRTPTPHTPHPPSPSEKGGEGGNSSGSKSRRKPETPIPDDFAVTEDMRAWAKEKGYRVDLDHETVQFIEHALMHDRRCRDWLAAWRKWIDKAQRIQDERVNGGTFASGRRASSASGHTNLPPRNSGAYKQAFRRKTGS